MEDNLTEKFALLNLLKTLQGISLTEKPAESTAQEPPPSAANQSEAQFNAMASILERHEAISNRVKNKK